MPSFRRSIGSACRPLSKGSATRDTVSLGLGAHYASVWREPKAWYCMQSARRDRWRRAATCTGARYLDYCDAVHGAPLYCSWLQSKQQQSAEGTSDPRSDRCTEQNARGFPGRLLMEPPVSDVPPCGAYRGPTLTYGNVSTVAAEVVRPAGGTTGTRGSLGYYFTLGCKRTKLEAGVPRGEITGVTRSVHWRTLSVAYYCECAKLAS